VPDSRPENKKRQNAKLGLFVGGLIGMFLIGMGLGNGSIVIGWQKQSSQSAQLPSNLNYASVEKVYDLLRKDFDGKLEEDKLLDGLKQGLVEASGDQYTEYLSAEKAKEFNNDLNGTFTGIGAQLGKNDQGNIIIVSPIDGFPAKKAGLQPKDVIAEVDGQSTTKWTVDQAVDKIRGEAGTIVKLRVIRNDIEDLKFQIRREEIKIPSVESKVIKDNIGYIRISQFGEDTSALAQKAAQDLKAKNVKGIVLDLRGNPGGLLKSAVDVTSLWLKDGKLVLKEKRGEKVIKTYKAKGSPILDAMPTIVLIDGGSASASEITAGALKDNGVAKLIGEKSFGKGSVQTIENLPDGSAIKVTIARWFTPNDKNIDKQGIEPDINIEQKNNSNTDAQLEAAINELKK